MIADPTKRTMRRVFSEFQFQVGDAAALKATLERKGFRFQTYHDICLRNVTVEWLEPIPVYTPHPTSEAY